MKLTLEQDNIETALRAYLQSNYGLSLRNKVAVMDFTAGRGKNGLSVLVTINDANIPGDDSVGTASVGELIAAAKPAAFIGDSLTVLLSATDKRIAAQADAKPGTVGALLNTAEAEAKVDTAAPVVVAEVAQAVISEADAAGEPATGIAVATKTQAPAVEVAAEAEVAAVTTETAVAAEAPAVDVKPAPKTSSGLFA